MQTKLTLRLDRTLVEKAKRYSRKVGKPVSGIVADYFRSIDEDPSKTAFPVSPLVKSLRGILRDGTVDVSDYHRYLEDKHR